MLLFTFSCEKEIKPQVKTNTPKKILRVDSIPKPSINLVGTIWIQKSQHPFSSDYDSLKFLNKNTVEYYLSDISWTFTSTYSTIKDTLSIKTTLAGFEVKDASKLKPDLIQRYIIHQDSLNIIFQKNIFRSGEKVSTREELQAYNTFYKLFN